MNKEETLNYLNNRLVRRDVNDADINFCIHFNKKYLNADKESNVLKDLAAKHPNTFIDWLFKAITIVVNMENIKTKTQGNIMANFIQGERITKYYVSE